MSEIRKGLWHNSNFMKLWIGKTISDVGNGITDLALPLMAVIVLSATSAQVAIMSLIRTPKQVLSKTKAQQHIWHDILTGLHVVIDDPILRVLALSGGIFEFFGNFIGTLYILYIVRILHANPLIVGFLVATGGASALIGAFVAERVLRKFSLGRTIGWALFGYGITGLLTPLAQGPMFVVLSMLFAAQLLGDILVEIYLIGEISLRQSIIPSHLLGRANASMQFFTRGVGPIGALIAGFVIVPLVGIRIAILIGVLGVILAGLCILLSPVHSIKKDVKEG